jgi:ABC-type bacteriocin/lantibiotic exporter with double-glycine peptidase domain
MSMISVVHFTQNHPKSCVPASVRMVLDSLGIIRSEAEICQALDTRQEGTSLLNLALLSDVRWGIVADVDTYSIQELKQNLEQTVPMIVAVETRHLLHWEGKDNCFHAMVVVGYDKECVYFNDPMFPDAPKQAAWEDFTVAWDAMGYFGAIIRQHKN